MDLSWLVVLFFFLCVFQFERRVSFCGYGWHRCFKARRHPSHFPRRHPRHRSAGRSYRWYVSQSLHPKHTVTTCRYCLFLNGRWPWSYVLQYNDVWLVWCVSDWMTRSFLFHGSGFILKLPIFGAPPDTICFEDSIYWEVSWNSRGW